MMAPTRPRKTPAPPASTTEVCGIQVGINMGPDFRVGKRRTLLKEASRLYDQGPISSPPSQWYFLEVHTQLSYRPRAPA